MKKFLSLLIITFFSLTAMGQVSIGNFTMFPNKKMMGSAWKPQMGIAKANDKYYLSICCTANNTYYSFDANSVVLIRFSDDSVEKLTLTPNIEVGKNYSNSYVGSVLVSYYKTFSYYELSDSCLEKIKNKEHMKKVRITYTNGNLNDYDITDSYMSKFAEGLYNSYILVESSDAVRKQNMNDVESGF